MAKKWAGFGCWLCHTTLDFALVVRCGFDTGTELLHVRTVRTCKERQGDDHDRSGILECFQCHREYPGSATGTRVLEMVMAQVHNRSPENLFLSLLNGWRPPLDRRSGSEDAPLRVGDSQHATDVTDDAVSSGGGSRPIFGLRRLFFDAC